LVRRQLNPDLALMGVLLTMVDRRNNLCRQVMAEVRRHFSEQVFDTVIPRNIALAEAPSHGRPIIMYNIASSGAQAYLGLAQEALYRTGREPALACAN